MTQIAVERSQIGQRAINSVHQNNRDPIQGLYQQAFTRSASSFASADGPEVLGYAQARPIYKAAPRPAVTPITYAAWGMLYGDYERRTGTFAGIDIGRKTDMVGGLVGADAIIMGAGGNAFVIGILGGNMASRTRNNDGSIVDIDGPTLGVYAAYIVGGFSVDGTVKVDFLDIDRTAAGAANFAAGLNNYVGSLNVNYKVPLGTWWVEPTVGISYTRSDWDSAGAAIGFQDGTEVRVQGGARIGASFLQASGVRLDPSFAALAYSPVSIDGGSVAVAIGAPTTPTDEGKVFGQFTGKLNVIWNNRLSSHIEGEVRGRTGVTGVAGRAGVRYSFQ